MPAEVAPIYKHKVTKANQGHCRSASSISVAAVMKGGEGLRSIKPLESGSQGLSLEIREGQSLALGRQGCQGRLERWTTESNGSSTKTEGHKQRC